MPFWLVKCNVSPPRNPAPIDTVAPVRLPPLSGISGIATQTDDRMGSGSQRKHHGPIGRLTFRRFSVTGCASRAGKSRGKRVERDERGSS
jgi:hypothetical protein